MIKVKLEASEYAEILSSEKLQNISRVAITMFVLSAIEKFITAVWQIYPIFNRSRVSNI